MTPRDVGENVRSDPNRSYLFPRRSLRTLPRCPPLSYPSDETAFSTEKERGIERCNFRIHANDKVVFQKLLRDYDLNIQRFADACVQAIIRGDPAILQVIKDYKELQKVPKDDLKLYQLSHRERKDIFEELEGRGKK